MFSKAFKAKVFQWPLSSKIASNKSFTNTLAYLKLGGKSYQLPYQSRLETKPFEGFLKIFNKACTYLRFWVMIVDT